jgi:hypothetical protein
VGKLRRWDERRVGTVVLRTTQRRDELESIQHTTEVEAPPERVMIWVLHRRTVGAPF